MSDLSKLRISGTDYNLKDAQARSDITALNGSLEQLTELHLNTISGYITSGGALVDSSQSSEVTTSWVSVKTGDIIIAKVQYNNSHSGWGCISLRGINYEWIKRSVKSSDTSNTWFYEYVVENDGYVAVSYRTYDDVLDAKYYVIRCATNHQISDISRHGNNIGNIYTNYDGGINSNGGINQNENTYHTELIAVDKNAIISYVVDSRHLNVDTIYVAIALYDHNKTFIKRINISTGEIKTTFFNGTIAIKDIEGYENIKYVSVVHKHDANSFFGISFIATELQKIEPKYKVNFKKSPIRSINHRGYNTVAPENTIPAFKKSKEMGFNIVETDLRQTSDGVFVLLHDAKINRTARNSDGTELSTDISIINITYEQALTYDFGIWKGSEYAGTKIPTLNDFLDLCRNINLSVYLEIESSDVYTENDINSVLELIKRKGMREKVTIICSNLDVLTIIKDIDPAWRIGFLKSSSSTITLEQISSLKTGYNEVFVDAQQGIVDSTLSDDCYNYGLELECWVPNTESGVVTKAQYVTGITSDSLVAEKVLYNYYMDIDYPDTVDDELSGTSEKPVQNKVIKARFDSVDQTVAGIMPVDTASGTIASFSDGADDMPVKSLVVNIDPVQSGSGDPSPDNIRPISGWTGATLTCNNETINIDWTDEAGTVYSGTLDVTNGKLTVDMAMVDLGTLKWNYFERTNPPHFGADVSGMEPQTNNLLCSNYAAVKNNPNTNAYGTIRATSQHSSNGIKISDTAYTDTNAFTAAMSGVQLVYELANPITYQLTPQEVKTILGENNIFADTGDVSVEYRADIKKYIDKVVATAISALS